MLKKGKIYFLFFLQCILSLSIRGEIIDTVCMGDQFVCYVADGAFAHSTFEWQLLEGGEIVTTQADTVWVDWGNVPGLYALTVREISPAGCAGELKTADVQVLGTLPEWKDVRICKGEVIDLNPGDFLNYQWKSGSMEPTLKASNPGYYPITLQDINGCVIQDSIRVIVEELPEVNLDDQYEMFRDRQLVIDGSTQVGEDYVWFNGENGSVIFLDSDDIPSDQKVWLKVTSQFGCVGSDTASVEIIDVEKQITYPNVFSPNNDGINDVFRPLGKLESIESYQLMIFNRYGDKVFYSEYIKDAWDGTAAGIAQPTGTYVYLVKVTFPDGESKTFRGDITLLR